MSNGMSRRALAAGTGMGAGSIAGMEPAGAKGKRKTSGTLHGGSDGTVGIERNRVTVERVSRIARFGPDGTGGIVEDCRVPVPGPGMYIDYRLSGRTVAEPGSRSAFVPVQKAFRFRATGGSHDEAADGLVLDREAMGSPPTTRAAPAGATGSTTSHPSHPARPSFPSSSGSDGRGGVPGTARPRGAIPHGRPRGCGAPQSVLSSGHYSIG